MFALLHNCWEQRGMYYVRWQTKDWATKNGAMPPFSLMGPDILLFYLQEQTTPSCNRIQMWSVCNSIRLSSSHMCSRRLTEDLQTLMVARGNGQRLLYSPKGQFSTRAQKRWQAWPAESYVSKLCCYCCVSRYDVPYLMIWLWFFFSCHFVQINGFFHIFLYDQKW